MRGFLASPRSWTCVTLVWGHRRFWLTDNPFFPLCQSSSRFLFKFYTASRNVFYLHIFFMFPQLCARIVSHRPDAVVMGCNIRIKRFSEITLDKISIFTTRTYFTLCAFGITRSHVSGQASREHSQYAAPCISTLPWDIYDYPPSTSISAASTVAFGRCRRMRIFSGDTSRQRELSASRSLSVRLHNRSSACGYVPWSGMSFNI